MQFRHPEILYFLFLLAVPILVHLFQLRRFKKEFFTNVRFLKELSIQTRKSSKLKKYLLLATRLLLLACVIFAFAQPFFKAKDSRDVSNELYVVLDNSFSMQAKGKQGELLKRAVQELLETVPETARFSLLANDQIFWNTDIRSIRKDLQNLGYSAAPFEPGQQFTRIANRKSAFGKDVIVITDAVGLKRSQFKASAAQTNLYSIIPKAEQQHNVSIDSVYLKQSLDRFYEIGVRLKAYGTAPDEIPIALYNNGKLIAKTQLKMDAAQKEADFTIPKADFNGYAAITDKGLDYDNRFFFSISKPQKTKVIAVGDNAKTIFLSRIYTSEDFDYKTFELKALDYNQLEQQDAIVLNELDDIPQALQTTLKAFVSKGGNVIVIPAEADPVGNMNAFLANFGSIRFQGLQKGQKLISKIHFEHPLYQSVFEKKIENFQYPNTQSGFAIQTNAAAVLSYEDQSNFLSALAQPLGAVYVFSAPINKENSNFQNAPLVVPTFYNMAQPGAHTGVQWNTIGNDKPMMVDALLAKDEIVSLQETGNPEAQKFIPVQQILNQKVRLTFNDYPHEAGNFGVYKQAELIKNCSFNYPRVESDLTAANPDALSGFEQASGTDEIFNRLLTSRTDHALWKWFAIFALVFLITEMLIQKLVS